MTTLLIATTNAGKRDEYRTLLADLKIECLTLDEVGLTATDVPETGDTFVANALIKAQAYAKLSGLLTLSDDSGIVVDALNGAPGVLSARYAPTVDERNTKLLTALTGVPFDRRTAHFECAIALVTQADVTIIAEGHLTGHVGFEARGTHGHGYDPVFVLGDGRTLAEIYPVEKNMLSHRAKAFAALYPMLQCVLGL